MKPSRRSEGGRYEQRIEAGTGLGPRRDPAGLGRDRDRDQRGEAVSVTTLLNSAHPVYSDRMRVDDFDFELPPGLIAERPASPLTLRGCWRSVNNSPTGRCWI